MTKPSSAAFAALSGSELRKALSGVEDRGVVNAEGCGLLFEIARRDLRALVRVAFDERVPPDLAERHGMTALHVAAVLGHWFTLQQLVAGGASLGLADDRGDTALHHACRAIDRAEARTLVGPRDELVLDRVEAFRGLRDGKMAWRDAFSTAHFPESLRNYAGRSPLAVRALVLAGAPVDVPNTRGRTALHEAAYAGAADPMYELLKAGADLFARDREGATPIDLLRARGHTRLARTLARLAPGTKIGGDELLEAIRRRDPRAACLQLRFVRERYYLDRALSLASAYGDRHLVRFLLDHEADANAAYPATRRTPLHRAAENGHLAIVKLLLDRRATPRARDRDDLRPVDLVELAPTHLRAKLRAALARSDEP